MHTDENVKGYHPQDSDTIHEVNKIKELEYEVAELWKQLGGDNRLKAIARTHLETGFMFMAKSQFMPYDPYRDPPDPEERPLPSPVD